MADSASMKPSFARLCKDFAVSGLVTVGISGADWNSVRAATPTSCLVLHATFWPPPALAPMFFWCCGSRVHNDDGTKQNNQEEAPAETDWLLGGDPPVDYLGEGADGLEEPQGDFMREILREAEDKMINVMQDDSFQFKAKQPYGYTYNPYRPSRRYLEDSASPSTNDSYRQPHQHGGRGDGRSRRRRNTGRGRSRTNGASSSGANNAHNGNATTGNSRNGGSGAPPNSRSHSRSRSSSRSFARGHADYDDGYRGPGYAGYDEYDTNGYGYRASSSYYSSSSRSRSRSRSYDDDEDIDEIDRSRLEGEEGDASFSLDPAEEARLRRLQGPKLNARILPLPSKQIELDEEEERARRGEELFNRGMGQGPGGPVERERERARLRALRHRPRNGTGAGDDDLTPMQEAPGMDFSVADSTATNGNGNGHTDAPVETVVSADGLTKSLATTAGIPRAMFVEELNQVDHDAIVSLGDALWKALEDGLQIREAPKIVHGWDG